MQGAQKYVHIINITLNIGIITKIFDTHQYLTCSLRNLEKKNAKTVIFKAIPVSSLILFPSNVR